MPRQVVPRITLGVPGALDERRVAQIAGGRRTNEPRTLAAFR